LFTKKSQAVWISWVLLVGFVVAISAFVAQQIISMTEKNANDLEQYVYDTQECTLAGLDINYICQNSEVLNMNVSNIKDIKVDELLIRVFDGSGDAETLNQQINIDPGTTKTLNVGKSRIAKRIEVLPVLHINDKIVVCSSRLVEKDNIQDC
jgi:hypothetical protein